MKNYSTLKVPKQNIQLSNADSGVDEQRRVMNEEYYEIGNRIKKHPMTRPSSVLVAHTMITIFYKIFTLRFL